MTETETGISGQAPGPDEDQPPVFRKARMWWLQAAIDWAGERYDDTADWFDNENNRYAARGVAQFFGGAAALFIGVPILVSILEWAGDTPVGSHLSPLAALITDPIRHYLTLHTAELPVDAHILFDAWGTAGIVLLVAAWLRNGGARLGWIIYGVGTTAMAWAGAPHSGRDLAAGAAVAAWCLLSILALRGGLGLFRHYSFITNQVPEPRIERVDIDINGRSLHPVGDDRSRP